MSDNPLKIVPLRDGAPRLNDVPAQLRAMADIIERGAFPCGEVFPEIEHAIFLVKPVGISAPKLFHWGDMPTRYAEMGLFQHCIMLALGDTK